MQALKADDYQPHFFLPADWLSTNNDLLIGVSRARDIIFVKRQEVTVIKRGLDNVEQSTSNIATKRPSLIASRTLKIPLEDSEAGHRSSPGT